MNDRPNILVITSDQHHWTALGFNNPEVKTPNLDRLAREGTVFSRAYTVNPTCTPTRASMITGTYPSQHGAYSLGTKLPEDIHVCGDDFQNAGYRTALVGKAHFQGLAGTDEFPSLESYPVLQDLDFWRGFNGPFYGFERVELARNHTDEAHVGQHYALWMEEKGLENWRDYYCAPTGRVGGKDGLPAQRHKWPIPEEFHYDTWIAEKTNEFMTEYSEKDENFFLWASFFDPHPSYLVPEPWDTMYDPTEITVPAITPGEHDRNPPHFQMTQQEKPDFSIYREPEGNGCHGFGSHLHDRDAQAKNIAVYYGMVSLMDKHIGRILDRLEELGLADNTIVIFTTDHGHLFGQHGLRAKGAFHYEDLLKVPFIVRMPGKVTEGATSDALVSLADFAPTLLSVAGIDVPRCMTGLNQKPVFFGEVDSVRDHVVVENRHQPTTVHVKTRIDERYKVTVYYNHEYGELFDLQEDPGEVNNLWDDPASKELKAGLILKLLHAEMGKEPLPMPRVAGA